MSDINSFNKVILCGHVTTDVKAQKAKNTNKIFARFQIATNEMFKDKKPRTQWHHIVVWAKRAEFCGRWLQKGRLVHIEGKIRSRYWVDPQGTKRRITEIHVEQIILLGKKEDKEVSEEGEKETDEEREPGID